MRYLIYACLGLCLMSQKSYGCYTDHQCMKTPGAVCVGANPTLGIEGHCVVQNYAEDQVVSGLTLDPLASTVPSTQTEFDRLAGLYNTASMPNASDIGGNVVWKGTTVAYNGVDTPSVLLAATNTDPVLGARLWVLPQNYDGKSSAQKILDLYPQIISDLNISPTQPDMNSSALLTHVGGDIPSEDFYIRATTINNTSIFIVQELCRWVRGCRLGSKVVSLGAVISYSYYYAKLE